MGPQVWFEVDAHRDAYLCHPGGRRMFVQPVSSHVPDRVDAGGLFFDVLKSAILQRLRLDHRYRFGGFMVRGPHARTTGTPGQRKRLARALRDYVHGDLGDEDLAEELSCIGLGSWMQIPVELVTDGRVELGVCGHWLDRDGTERGPQDSGRVCGTCVDRGRYVSVGDQYGYWPADEVYCHDDGDYYTYEQEYADADADADSESYGRIGAGDDVMGHVTKDTSFESSSDGEFHIGVELEVEAPRGEVEDVTDAVREQLGGDFAVCKEDGSLGDTGVEIVTAPRRYQEQVARLSGLDLPEGTTAWDAGCCGLHVHISSRAFTKLTLGKFLIFWNSLENAKFIRKVAGRHPDQDDQARDYAKRLEVEGCAELLAPPSPPKAMKVHPAGSDRYQIVNLCHMSRGERARLGVDRDSGTPDDQSTVELRIFRASLRKARMFAQIEMAAATVYFCRDASWATLTESAFRSWLAGHFGRFPNLARFLGVARQVRPRQGQEALSTEEV